MQDKSDKTTVVEQEKNEPQAQPAVTVVNASRDRFPRRVVNSIKKRKKLYGSLALILVLVTVVSVVTYRLTDKTITIGDTKISQKQIENYSDAMAEYSRISNVDFGGESGVVAQDDLILNAALKAEAKKFNILLTQQDIDTERADQYASYGGKEAYDIQLSAAGLTEVMRVRTENNILKTKLEDKLLAKKNLLYINIPYDAPFVNRAADPAKIRKEAAQIMQTKYLPLFQQKLSKDEIAKQVEVNGLDENDNPDDPNAFFTRLVTMAQYIEAYSPSQNRFNDAEADPNIKEAIDTDEIIKKLETVGDYSTVTISKAGYIGIFRLESKTEGSYESWDAFLKVYKQKNAKKISYKEAVSQKREELGTNAKSVVGALTDFAMNIGTGSASAAPAYCSGHYVKFAVNSYDSLTGARVGGVKVTETRNNSGCPRSPTLSALDGSQSVTTKSNGDVFLYDNCYNPGPSWAQDPPDGFVRDNKYSIASSTQGTTGDPINVRSYYNSLNKFKGGWPRWTQAEINGAGTPIDIELYYKLKWSANATTSVKASAKPGETVTFAHSIVTTPAPGTGSYNWQVLWTDGNNNFKSYARYSNGDIFDGSETSRGTKNHPYNFTIPANAAKGTKYCQHIKFNPNSLGGGAETSNDQCVTVVDGLSPNITANPVCESGVGVVNGAAWDNDNFTTTLRVRITMDGTSNYVDINANATESNGNKHGYKFKPTTASFPAYNSSTSTSFTFTTYGVAVNGAVDGDTAQISKSIPACGVSATPPEVGVEPQNYERGQGGTVQIRHTITKDGCADGSTIDWYISGKAGNGTTYTDEKVTSTLKTAAQPALDLEPCQAAALKTVDGAYLDTLTPLPKSVQYKSKSGTVEETGEIKVFEVPYPRFYGNDVYSLGGSGSPESGKIIFNTRSSADSTKAGDGAAIEYAAVAKDMVNGAKIAFIDSAAFRSAAPQSPDGLTAQSANSMDELDDYTTELPTKTGDVVNWGASGYYDYDTSDVVIGPESGISKKVTISAKDIFINGDIETSVPAGAFSDDNTPVVLLVAEGNIYIDSSVRRIDAILSAPNGTIYTCANTDSAASPSYQVGRSSWHSTCNKRLTVNGAVLAKDIKLQRSVGTRLMAKDSEDKTEAGKIIVASDGGMDEAAEVFNFPVYLHYATPYLQNSEASKLNSVISAPPRL